MIINTGGRTDIVQYYSKWLLNRFNEGYVYSRNPLFQNKVTRYELTPDKVDCVNFCSKNYEPILGNLSEILLKFNTYFNYTITSYGKDIEPGVPTINKSIETLKKLSSIVGKQRLAWRYDPIFLTEKYTISHHLESFDKMAGELSPHIDKCIINFIELYKNIEMNMPELIKMTKEDKDNIANEFGKISLKYGLRIQLCEKNGDYSNYGIKSSGCMTLETMGSANGITFKQLKHKGMKKGCNSIESRDIGAYNTCINGCRYCYANKQRQKAVENYKNHDPDSPLILGNIKKTDIIQQGLQKSFIML